MRPLKVLLSFVLLLTTAPCAWAQIRIMPLGDSITLGIGPSDPLQGLNGYRRDLWVDLESMGYDIDMVGAFENGTFDEKQHEGVPGATAAEVAFDDINSPGIYRRLNDNPADIVLLHIGTNALTTSANNVTNILSEIDRWEDDKNTAIIVILARIINRNCSTATPPCDESTTTTAFNVNVAKMAEDRRNILGDRILVVDMENGAGIDYRLVPNGDMIDTLHPSDSGYQKMAAKWFADGLLAILPQADAGADQSVDEGSFVTLDGSFSIDPDGGSLTYFWEQIFSIPPGTDVTLSGPTDPTDPVRTFTAPLVDTSGARLEFRLTVTDADGFQHSDTVFVDVNDVLLPPVADAGPDQTVGPGTTVTLDGSNSYDPNGILTAQQWEQVSGTRVNLNDPTALTTTFTAPAAAGEVLTFTLTVRDDNDQVSKDTVNVEISAPPTTNGGSGGGGCFIQTVIN